MTGKTDLATQLPKKISAKQLAEDIARRRLSDAELAEKHGTPLDKPGPLLDQPKSRDLLSGDRCSDCDYYEDDASQQRTRFNEAGPA